MRTRPLFAALALFPFLCQAQWVNCSGGDVPGELVVQAEIIVPVGQSTPGVTYAVNPSGTDSPTHEFAITRSNVMAADILGFELLGADDDGVFNPEDFGISEGQGFCITPVSYNLQQIRTLLDSIFFNNVVCCQVLNLASEGFCDTLSNLGYNSGTDVHDLNDVYRVMRLFDEDSTMSLEGFVFQITSVNNAGDVLPEECGAQAFPFCYAVKFPFSQQCYSYGPPSSIVEVAAITGLKAYADGNSIITQFSTSRTEKVTISIFGIDGRTLHTSEHVAAASLNRISIPFSHKGIFYVSVTHESGRNSVKLAAF
ncbi:MAG: T9SS type A sorting domain-containing protein [Flavobacteriales bacterium]|nr:T9SS type A sorting domain-containing protein [Flavobacteriales bacterium]